MAIQRSEPRPARELRGEVRADAYTRHLFADRREHVRERAAARRLPARRRRRRRRGREPPPRFGVPVVTPRRRHQPRRPDRRPGHRARHLAPHGRDPRDRRRAARRVRVGPGVVQDDLNRAVAAARARLRARHLDVQPGDARRHDRQQLVGQPLDRLRHHDRPRLRARGRARRRLARRPSGRSTRRSGRAAREADTLEGAIYRGLPDILRDHARAIAEDYPRHWRQSGGYRLDSPGARSFDLAKFVTGSEGTLVAITEATVGPDRAAEGAASSRSGTSTRVDEADRRDRATRSRSSRRRSR